ncbi:MAG: RagB/SusD family nutrient uptake outer membrane protein [Sphingobacterium sp.]|jgi:tetratricopeptide (TPR) repeat protein|nr:RagB/SusD family nutrient uptake outer membrane protein [Sphingobacterium sp.]
MNIRYFLIGTCLFLLSSCNNFLEVKPKGIIIPEKLVDYQGLLNAPSMTRTFPINLLDFTDDNLNSFEPTVESATANGYFWRPVLTLNVEANPDVWGPLYRSIYSANVIINGVMGAAEGTDEQKRSTRAEAYLVRAICYMDLLTVFAKSYNEATAATDPGVPLVISTDVNEKIPPRSSVAVTLESIRGDVEAAIADLPQNNINRYRSTKYAAYGLLTRIYLYMANYEEALKYVTLALEGPYRLLDYNEYADNTSVPVYDLNPEVLWQRAAVSGSPIFMLYSDDLKSYFENNDLRYTFLTLANNSGLGRNSFGGVYNFGITYPEMYLTQAELLARDGKIEQSMAIINNLRKHRILRSAYIDLSATSPDQALELVLMERRRELAYSGLRWFDMKRLDQEGRMPEVKRIHPVTKVVEATLSPKSPHYTFEMPARVKAFNPNIETNF